MMISRWPCVSVSLPAEFSARYWDSSPDSLLSIRNGQSVTSRSTAPASDTAWRINASQTTEDVTRDGDQCRSNYWMSLVWFLVRMRARDWGISSWTTYDMPMLWFTWWTLAGQRMLKVGKKFLWAGMVHLDHETKYIRYRKGNTRIRPV